MTRIELGQIGVSLNVSADDTYLHDAAELEKLGYSTIWVPGGQLTTLTPLADILDATSTISVAPAIIPLDLYGPDTVLATYADLETRHPGRFIVGLGGPQRAAKPLAALSQFLDQLDAAERPVPVDRRIVAAIGPRKLALAREQSAGTIPLLVTPEYTADARRILGPDSTLIVDELVVLESDSSRARDIARQPLSFLASVSGYAANFRRMGFNDTDVSDLSDRLVDAVTAWGDADAIAARVQAHLDAGADHVVLSVLNDHDGPDRLAVERELAHKLIH
ncbi:TIGR03620 family F420-dependent LLM class oxidoreductase [Actinobacteria bacterium YIM 96077]|uniref:LLM class F420-dependent oxidoreductase n=1 Tax=Phytoactinopolyspora halophila TaxID=1981511 RepID=A0A329QFG8_9ACTN|nr:TIGR03620 family F420-dependent LLM class oxidoreductase [Phytoactinopolyspora halophila]AYY13095.1 TIGR03620 family F420-dependent LLM class oxidoreductase [Actinobacteria bacterium YIM 96077]RAW11107.1 LLM class F420-dependent oxidoreductase [Phytoactinopolyspora halophila]